MTLVSVIHGPNLQLLGTREPEIYGHGDLASLNAALIEAAGLLGLRLEIFQSNHEGALVDRIGADHGRVAACVLNAAAYTHTSVALRDAVAAVDYPVVEVHLSVPGAREEFRQRNLLEGVVRGRIEGFGRLSYVLALRAASAIAVPRGS